VPLLFRREESHEHSLAGKEGEASISTANKKRNDKKVAPSFQRKKPPKPEAAQHQRVPLSSARGEKKGKGIRRYASSKEGRKVPTGGKKETQAPAQNAGRPDSSKKKLAIVRGGGNRYRRQEDAAKCPFPRAEKLGHHRGKKKKKTGLSP